MAPTSVSAPNPPMSSPCAAANPRADTVDPSPARTDSVAEKMSAAHSANLVFASDCAWEMIRTISGSVTAIGAFDWRISSIARLPLAAIPESESLNDSTDSNAALYARTLIRCFSAMFRECSSPEMNIARWLSAVAPS